MHGIRQVALAALAALAACALGTGCDTHAVGVEECRAIEKARCQAAGACNLRITASNEAECERFAQDNCFHGLPIAAAPRQTDLDRCVAAIQAAGACARKHDGKFPAKSCAVGVPNPSNATVCEIVQDPEESGSCSFLLDQPAPAATSAPADAGAG